MNTFQLAAKLHCGSCPELWSSPEASLAPTLMIYVVLQVSEHHTGCLIS